MRRVLVPWLSAAALLCAAFAASTCGSGETATGTTGETCPSGLCGDPTSSGSGGSGGSSSSSGTGGGTMCIESWSCSPWQTDGTSDAATRVCTDANKCGSTANKPIEAATLPKLDVDYYKCKVEPIFDRGCAHQGCHGTETGRALRVYARGRLRNKGEQLPQSSGCPGGGTVLSDNCIGSIECACWDGPHTATEWQRNFDAARGFANDAQGAPIPAGMEDTSELIAQPIVGGKSHAGVHLFASGDPEHTTLKAWLSGAKLGMTCTTTN